MVKYEMPDNHPLKKNMLDRFKDEVVQAVKTHTEYEGDINIAIVPYSISVCGSVRDRTYSLQGWAKLGDNEVNTTLFVIPKNEFHPDVFKYDAFMAQYGMEFIDTFCNDIIDGMD